MQHWGFFVGGLCWTTDSETRHLGAGGARKNGREGSTANIATQSMGEEAESTHIFQPHPSKHRGLNPQQAGKLSLLSHGWKGDKPAASILRGYIHTYIHSVQRTKYARAQSPLPDCLHATEYRARPERCLVQQQVPGV